jgi:hypothetical protein
MPPSSILASTDIPAPRSAARTRIASALPAASAVLCLAIALLLYRPWEPRPFDILDFSEFLPLLTAHDSFGERVAALVRHYFMEQGRANVLSYGIIALKWTLFGGSPVAWQLARFALLLASIGGAFSLLRRLGASAAAAALGASLFLVANTASVAWTRLTMAEPLGLALMLVAAHASLTVHSAARWKRQAIVIALALTLAVLAKEMLIACVPFVLLLAMRDSSGRMTYRTRRVLMVVAMTAVGCAVALVPVVLAAFGATSESFTAAYGAGSFTPAWYAELVSRMLLLKPVLFPGNLILAVVLLTGLLVALERKDRPALVLAGIALSLPLVAAVLYLPWPKFEQFYGLPYLLGLALLLAVALTQIERRWQHGKLLAYAGCVVALGYHALNAAQSARESAARQVVNARVADVLASHSRGDSVVVAMSYLVRQSWQGTGPTLQRYALAAPPGARVGAATDVPCAEGGRRYKEGLGRSVLVTFSNQCGSLPRGAVTVREHYSYLDWATLRVVHDSLRADILLPPR